MKTAECVAWAKKYCEERGYPIKAFGGSAINGWLTGSPFDDTWVKVHYKKGLFPQQGDIIFWSEDRCEYGHVAVVNKFCNANVLRYSDQNGTGKQDKISRRFSDYRHVVGWMSKLTGK